MIKKGEWIVKDSKIFLKNRWMEVIEDSVVRPTGEDGTYTTVNILPGVVILAIDSNQNVYLSKNYLYAIDKEIITTFGGGLENDKNPLEAAKRELKEESGLTAKKWTEMGDYDDATSSIINCPVKLYLAEGLAEGEQELEESESIKVFKVSLNEAIDWVMNGKITHPITALLILKADYYLNHS